MQRRCATLLAQTPPSSSSSASASSSSAASAAASLSIRVWQHRGRQLSGAPTALEWPPPGPRDATAGSAYTTRTRSPYAVLRSLDVPVDRCGANLRAPSSVASSPQASSSALSCGGGGGGGGGCGAHYCCCTALLHGTTGAPTASQQQQQQQPPGRAELALALKVSATDGHLRHILGGDEAFAKLVGFSDATLVALCRDPRGADGGQLSQRHRELSALLLLNDEESNRVKWLREEGDDVRQDYRRAPSLRALLIMWSLARSEDPHAAPPSADDISQVVHRYGQQLQQLNTAGSTSGNGNNNSSNASFQIPPVDLAALACMGDRTCYSATTAMILPMIAARLDRGSHTGNDAPDAVWEERLLSALILHAYVLGASTSASASSASSLSSSASGGDGAAAAATVSTTAHASADSGHGDSPHAPGSGGNAGSSAEVYTTLRPAMELLRVVGDVVEQWRSFTDKAPDGTLSCHSAFAAVMRELSGSARALANTCSPPPHSPHLYSLVVWMLREMPQSAMCRANFKTLAGNKAADAVAALEESGLLSKQDLRLEAVLRDVLPLVEYTDSEEVLNMVFRDVIASLEDRLRRSTLTHTAVSVFSASEIQLLAELGTRVFGLSSPSAFNSFVANGEGMAREQMEELHVMDGSPWALCVSSYRSLKEMLTGVVRDHRKLKAQVQEQVRQVQEQMRNIGITVTGGVGASNKESTGGQSSSSSGAEGESAAAAGPAVSDEEGGGGAAAPEDELAGRGAGAPPVTRATALTAELQQRFLVLVENVVRALVDEDNSSSGTPIVVCSELFAFVNRHVPVPNIQDEYRRKIFLLVNVAEDPRVGMERRRRIAAKRALERKQREARYREQRGRRLFWLRRKDAVRNKAEDLLEDDAESEIPAELRFLVSSLPLTLSPWASVMILREVLAESAGQNPRYTYVLNAAVDLQLPMSTTRSRIATTMNMWRFLNSQSHKLSLRESVAMRRRCIVNLPLSYILSSYWSLLTSSVVAAIILLSVVGIDYESQLVANTLFQKFAPWEVMEVELEQWNKEEARDLAADYLGQEEIAQHNRPHSRQLTSTVVSSASYLFLGQDDQRRPMTVVTVSSDPEAIAAAAAAASSSGRGAGRTGLDAAAEAVAEEYACASAVLQELSLHVPFPFFLDVEKPLPLDHIVMRVAERIRRVSFNNTWFLPRMIIRTFPLGRTYTENMLVSHMCAQANLTRRRVTFLIYIHDGVPVTPRLLSDLQSSILAQSANLVLVVHDRSLLKGGTTPSRLAQWTARSMADAAANVPSLENLLPKASQLHALIGPQPAPAPAPAATAAAVAGETSAAAAAAASWSPPPQQQQQENGGANTAVTSPSSAAEPSSSSSSSSSSPSAGGGEFPRVLPYCKQLYLLDQRLTRLRTAAVPSLRDRAGGWRAWLLGWGRAASPVTESMLLSQTCSSPYARRFGAARLQLQQRQAANARAAAEGSGGVSGLVHGVWNYSKSLVTRTSDLVLGRDSTSGGSPPPPSHSSSSSSGTPATERDSETASTRVVALPFDVIRSAVEAAKTPVSIISPPAHATRAALDQPAAAVAGASPIQ